MTGKSKVVNVNFITFSNIPIITYALSRRHIKVLLMTSRMSNASVMQIYAVQARLCS